MIQQHNNPFAKLALITPKSQLGYYDQYCQTQVVGRVNVDRSPFRRKVDLWFAGLSIAARKQLEPTSLKKKESAQFITGEIFNGENNWRIHLIMLVSIAVDGKLEVIQDPSRMIDIANGLAAAGVEHIVEMLREGDQTPIWNLSEALDLLQSDIYRTKDPADLLNEVFQ